jgi:ELMO domain-containing protein
MLMGVWERLRPGRKIKARKSNEWIELGFQAEDPATDFRGAGLLGLINLHGWVDTVEGR